MKQFLWIMVVIVIGALGACAQVGRAVVIQEQTQFSAEDDGVKVPVRIPDDAWAVLKSDADVKNQLEREHLSSDEMPRSWFSALVVHLHSPGRKDLFVAAQDRLAGANISQFWIFLDTPNGMKLVASGAAHDEIIGPARWHGYRIIELDSMTCCRIDTTWLRFENGQYKDYRHVSKELK